MIKRAGECAFTWWLREASLHHPHADHAGEGGNPQARIIKIHRGQAHPLPDDWAQHQVVPGPADQDQ